MRRLRNWLIVLGGGVVLIVTGGTLGFIWIEHYPPFDAFYMTLITISTVGYAELHPLSFWGRVFNSFLIFFGVTMMLLAVGGMTQVIIELELTQYFGKRRTRKMIDKLQDHIIVCGFGRVGRGAAHELQRAGVPFLVVDKSEERVEWAIRDGMLGVLADATDDETLKHAGIMRAKGLIATLQSDADNLFVILSAKALKPTLQVSARVASEQSEKKMRLAGADYVFAPYDMTGNRMAQVMLKPHVFQFIDFTTKGMGLDVGIEQFSVPASSEFASKSLIETQDPQRAGRDCAGHPEIGWKHAIQSAGGGGDSRRRLSDRDGRGCESDEAGAGAGRGARVKVLTAAQMRDVDKRTAELGIPNIILMENAGHRVVEFLEREYAPLAKQRIVVICGKGNNGGDGLVVARQLYTRIQPKWLRVVLAADPNTMQGDALANYKMLEAVGCPCVSRNHRRDADWRRWWWMQCSAPGSTDPQRVKRPK